MRRLTGILLLLVASCSKLAPIEARHERAPAVPRAFVAEPTPMAGASPSVREAGDRRSAAPAPTGSGAPPAPLEGPVVETWQIDDSEVVVTIPVGAREPRPVLVGVHGAQDRPDWACAQWQATVASWAFVVCPKGVPWRRNNAWGSPTVLAERADRALVALRERYGKYVADGPATYAGFSQGGTLASKVVALRPGTYDTAILVEVGHTRLDARTAVAGLAKGHVSRLIVSCATTRCLGLAKRMQGAAGEGLGLMINDGGIGRGHFFDELMFRTLGRTIARSTAGDARWSGFASAVAAKWPADDASTPRTD
jgi:hypothetical protein